MKKMIKKLLTIACCLVMCIMVLSGCSWLTIDNYRYYNQVVVSIGDKTFNKRELIEAFSNYGYQYYQSYGYSLEEALESTMDSMIDRWLLLDKYIKTKDEYKLTDDEKLFILQETFDYMQDSIFTYEEQVRKEWNKTIENGEEVAEDEPLRATETEYTPKTDFDYVPVLDEGGDPVQDDKGNEKVQISVFRVNQEDHDHDDVYVDPNLKLTDHFSKDRQVVTDEKVSNEAWTRYIKSLQDSAKNEGRSTNENDVLLYEENRLLELHTNNYYLEKFQNEFNNNLPVEVEKVLEYYKTNYKSQKAIYTANESAYHTAMQNAASTYVYFHPNSGNEYVNVKHILINFTDAQKAAITDLDSEFGITNDGSDEDEKRKENPVYQSKKDFIVKQTKTKVQLDGKVVEMNALVSDDDNISVWEYVQNHVTAANFTERCRQFNDLVYIFNDDEGFMNSEFDYVVNLDTSVTDQMVKPFADGVRSLDKSNGGAGAGSMKYIVSEYGIHIIFHAGNVTNLVEENNIDNITDEELLRLLCETTTTPESNKSIFNLIYDTLAIDEYNDMTTNLLETLKTELKNEGTKITYYRNNYKDLFE